MSQDKNVQEIKAGETVRFYITAIRWFEVKHNGWTIEVTSPSGVGIHPKDRNKIMLVTLDEATEDEI